MGYAGVRGGQEAIVAAERLVQQARYGGSSPWLELDQITERLPLAVDRVMGEGGLWAPELAARAIRQSQGDLLEAAQLLRAHRSTLPRLGYSLPVSTDELQGRRGGSVPSPQPARRSDPRPHTGLLQPRPRSHAGGPRAHAAEPRRQPAADDWPAARPGAGYRGGARRSAG